jgi:hypothetical protein
MNDAWLGQTVDPPDTEQTCLCWMRVTVPCAVCGVDSFSWLACPVPVGLKLPHRPRTIKPLLR